MPIKTQAIGKIKDSFVTRRSVSNSQTKTKKSEHKSNRDRNRTNSNAKQKQKKEKNITKQKKPSATRGKGAKKNEWNNTTTGCVPGYAAVLAKIAEHVVLGQQVLYKMAQEVSFGRGFADDEDEDEHDDDGSGQDNKQRVCCLCGMSKVPPGYNGKTPWISLGKKCNYGKKWAHTACGNRVYNFKRMRVSHSKQLVATFNKKWKSKKMQMEEWDGDDWYAAEEGAMDV